jgi:hypothetical protein
MGDICHHSFMMIAELKKLLLTRRIFLLFHLLFSITVGFAQDYNYINYDVKDGLAGSTVYAMCQDKDGFMWFATEAGVSRFDGTHFKNFSTSDGLPEIEVLSLFADSSGRVWMAPFKSTICYYYNGKIYNQENDSLLKKINISQVIYAFAEDRADSSIIMINAQRIYIYKPGTGEIKEIEHYLSSSLVRLGPNPFGRGIICATNDQVFLIVDGKKTPWSHIVVPDGYYVSEIFPDRSAKFIKYPPGPSTVEHVISPAKTIKVSFVNSNSGSWMVDSTRNDRFSKFFLPGKNISHTLTDNENNIWFSTFGSGVFKLPSQEFITFQFRNNKTPEIFSIEKVGNKLLAGSGFTMLNEIEGSKVTSYDLKKYCSYVPNMLTLGRILCIKKMSEKNIVLGTDGLLIKYDGNLRNIKQRTYGVKSIDRIDDHTLFMGSSSVAAIFDIDNLTSSKVLWYNRATAVSYYNNEYYIGTVDGLYIANRDHQVRYAGDLSPGLGYRVSYFLKMDDGRLWIATYGGGMVCIKGDRVVQRITEAQGLTSNVCRTLFLHNNYLWVGTDKGLNKIDMGNATKPIVNYTTADGLPSNIINAIYIDSNKIYVGSPAGLTYFDESKISNFSRCNLKILDLSFSNKTRVAVNHYELKHTENSLKVAFAGISFKSGGDILYRYRLKGLSDTWDSTRQTVLEYPSLPPGTYELQLEAINKFGKASDMASIPFTIITPYWQTLWFRIGLVALVIGATWLLVSRRFRIIRKREREKAALQQKMNDMEQMALRAQMNPHFIFNCLNSIQNFIINNNLEATNQYLTEFAYLIRQTLDNSDKGAISVSNETRYLTRYLELEKMRFGHSFDYSIEIDPRLDADSTRIPTMILQPYVENCIRHGIRHKREGAGLVAIKFLQKKSGLLCIVEDNGIGREKAHEFKSYKHVEYQSRGMSLTADRINILNRQHADHITIEVTDLKDEAQQARGTQVAIYIPGNVLTKIR